MSLPQARLAPPPPEPDLLFDARLGGAVEDLGEQSGDLEEQDAASWATSRPLCLAGAASVDLYFELRASMLLEPRWCHWYAEFSLRSQGPWFRETIHACKPDGTVAERAALHHFCELAPAELVEVSERKDLHPTDIARHVRLAAAGSYLRIVLRGENSHARIWARPG